MFIICLSFSLRLFSSRSDERAYRGLFGFHLVSLNHLRESLWLMILFCGGFFVPLGVTSGILGGSGDKRFVTF